MAGLPLNEIAKKIGFSHDGSVSDSVAKFDRQVNENLLLLLAELMRKAENIISK